MSGRLIGEVLDAREAGLLDKLSPGEMLALLAIAEKCHTTDRQGSVRVARIGSAMGRSDATAKRATRRLRDLGLIREVKRGYKSHGIGFATVYEVGMLGSPRVIPAEAEVLSSPRTLPAQSDERDLPGSPKVIPAQSDSRGCSAQNEGVLSSNREGAQLTQGDLHDGYLDGFHDGGNLSLGRGSGGSASHPLDTASVLSESDQAKLASVQERIVLKLRKVGSADNRTLREALPSAQRKLWPVVRELMLARGDLRADVSASSTTRMYRLAESVQDPFGAVDDA